MDTKRTVYAVITNSDLNEGRGHQMVRRVCEMESTALRLAKKADVQGCDGIVAEMEVEKSPSFHDHWLIPQMLCPPSHEDIETERRIKLNRQKEKQKQAAIEAAKAAGLTEEQIEALRY